MKNLKRSMVLLVLIAAFSSCQKEPIKIKPIAGTYKVSSLIINGTDITENVAEYTITFDDNGMMSVHDSMSTYDCNWSDNGTMCSGAGDYHFDMGGCPDDSPMNELDRDWTMDNQTDSGCTFHEKSENNNALSLQKI